MDKQCLQKRGYRIEHKVGGGSSGNVYKVVDSKGKPYACKVIDFENISCKEAGKKKIDMEIAILKECCKRSKNVVEYIDSFASEKENVYYIIMEYCAGGNLKEWVKDKNAGEEMCIEIFKHILLGTRAFRDIMTAHRDLKLENILVTEDKIIKICDFGHSKQMKNLQTNSLVGTLYTMAPEVLKNCKELRSSPYGNKCDIWSLGVIYYYLLFKQYPFGSDHPKAQHQNVQKDLDFPPSEVSEQSKQFLKRCLKVNPQERIDWEEIEYYLLFTKFPSFNEEIVNAKSTDPKRLEYLKQFYIQSCSFLNIKYPTDYISYSFQSSTKTIILNIDPDTQFQFYCGIYREIYSYIFKRLKYAETHLPGVLFDLKIEFESDENEKEKEKKEKERFNTMIGYLIVFETLEQSERMIESLKNKENILRFHNWKKFIQSPFYQTLMSQFIKSNEGIKKQLECQDKAITPDNKLKLKLTSPPQRRMKKTEYLCKLIVRLNNTLNSLDIQQRRAVMRLLRFLIYESSGDYKEYEEFTGMTKEQLEKEGNYMRKEAIVLKNRYDFAKRI